MGWGENKGHSPKRLNIVAGCNASAILSIWKNNKVFWTHQDQLLGPQKTTQKSDPVSESIFQTLLELWQPRCHDHCAGEPALLPDHPLSENSKGEKLIYLLLLIHANRIRYDCLLTCVLVLFCLLVFLTFCSICPGRSPKEILP